MTAAWPSGDPIRQSINKARSDDFVPIEDDLDTNNSQIEWLPTAGAPGAARSAISAELSGQQSDLEKVMIRPA
jgi:hypothetical protein